MEPEFKTETPSSEVVVPVVADSDRIVHDNSSEGVFTNNHTQLKFSRIETVDGELSRAAGVLAGGSRHPGPTDTTPQQRRTLRRRVRRRRRQTNAPFTSSNIIRRQVEETSVEEDDTSCTLGRFLNKDHFERYIAYIAIAVAVVTQMNGSSESQKIRSVIFLGVIFAVYAMELWAISRNFDIHMVKWKVIIFGIAFNSTKTLSFYLLLCILKPEWLSWYVIVKVCISATAYTCSGELKTKFIWCCEKGVRFINYVIDKVLKPIRKDPASPALAPTRASV